SDRGGAPATALAVNHEVAGTVEGRERAGDVTERDEPCAGDPGDVDLVRFAHIDEVELVVTLKLFRELSHRDFRHAGIDLRFLVSGAAELVIVDQLAELARAAGRAGGIPAHANGAEPGTQCVDQEESPRERITGAEDQ